jgi:hypothetical protein
MPLPNVTGEIIAQGYNCHVRVGPNPTDTEYIALVTSFQITEDFEVESTKCVGNHGPVSIDSHGYKITATIDGFLPFKKALEGPQYAGGGTRAIIDLIPARAKFNDGRTTPKIAYLYFYNRKAGKILAALHCVMVTSNGISAEGGAYVRNSVGLVALSA